MKPARKEITRKEIKKEAIPACAVLFIATSELGVHEKKWQAAWLAMPASYRCVPVNSLLAADDCLRQETFHLVVFEDEWIVQQPTLTLNWVQTHLNLALVVLGQSRLGVRAWMAELGAQECLLKQEVSASLLRDVFQQALIRKQLEIRLRETQDELAIKGVQLETLAYTDALTALGNRFFFYQSC